MERAGWHIQWLEPKNRKPRHMDLCAKLGTGIMSRGRLWDLGLISVHGR